MQFANRQQVAHTRKRVRSRCGLFAFEQARSSYEQSSPAIAKLPMIVASPCLGTVAVFALPDRSPIFPTSSYAAELVKVEFNGSAAFGTDAVHDGRSHMRV